MNFASVLVCNKIVIYKKAFLSKVPSQKKIFLKYSKAYKSAGWVPSVAGKDQT